MANLLNNKIGRIRILSGKQFSRSVKIAGKRVKLKQNNINRYPSKDIGVGNGFCKIGYTAPWYITKGGIKNWFFQKWINFYTEDYFMVINYRLLGIEFSMFRNLRLHRPWQATVDGSIIRLINKDEEDDYCSVCQNGEDFKSMNKPYAVVTGKTRCHYCGNQVFLCKTHFGLLKNQISKIY